MENCSLISLLHVTRTNYCSSRKRSLADCRSVLRLLGLAGLFVLLAVVGTAVRASENGPRSRDKMIVRRLQVELEEVKSKNDKLRKRVDKLTDLTQRLRERVRQLEDDFASSGSNSSEPKSKSEPEPETESVQEDSPTKPAVQQESRSRESTRRKRGDVHEKIRRIQQRIIGLNNEKPWLNWEYGPYRSYPVLQAPLDQKIKKIITDIDSLTRLAHQFYLDAQYWEPLYEFNSDRLETPNSLPTGRTIVLPPLSELKARM